MRYFLLFFFSLSLMSVQAQLLNPEIPWFELESFFYEKEIKKRRIKHIRIESQDKKDRDIIKKGYDQLDYYFNREGRISAAHQILKFSKKLDTSKHLFYYNRQGQVYKKREINGPFDFSYYYMYADSLLQRSIKTESRADRNDTLYHRTYQYHFGPNYSVATCFNAAQKPFLQIRKEHKENLKTERSSYTRSGHYVELQWLFANGKLTERKHIRFSQKKTEESWQFQYRKNEVEEAFQFDEQGQKKYRLAVLLDENGLVKNVVVRDYQLKNTRIYYFKYSFY